MFKWAYRLSDAMFLYGGPMELSIDPATTGVIDLPRNPKPRVERYDETTGIRAATANEITAYDDELKQSATAAQFDNERLIKAVAIYFAQKLNIPLATARADILTILRGLS